MPNAKRHLQALRCFKIALWLLTIAGYNLIIISYLSDIVVYYYMCTFHPFLIFSRNFLPVFSRRIFIPSFQHSHTEGHRSQLQLPNKLLKVYNVSSLECFCWMYTILFNAEIKGGTLRPRDGSSVRQCVILFRYVRIKFATLEYSLFTL